MDVELQMFTDRIGQNIRNFQQLDWKLSETSTPPKAYQLVSTQSDHDENLEIPQCELI